MSFYGHEIHVGVDCFSVEPLGLRPGGSLFLSPCELVNQNPQLGFRCSLGDNEGLVTTLHQFNLGGIADMVIEERYGEAPEYSYSAGKAKFSQAVNGVQTWHVYEATTEHGAIHKHTVTTKADGELVAAQSRKNEAFIAANDTTVFEQESIWDGTQ